MGILKSGTQSSVFIGDTFERRRTNGVWMLVYIMTGLAVSTSIFIATAATSVVKLNGRIDQVCGNCVLTNSVAIPAPMMSVVLSAEVNSKGYGIFAFDDVVSRIEQSIVTASIGAQASANKLTCDDVVTRARIEVLREIFRGNGLRIHTLNVVCKEANSGKPG